MRKLILVSPYVEASGLSKLDEPNEHLSLAHAYRLFLDGNTNAHMAQTSASAAEQYHTRIVKDLYKFFTDKDIECEVWLGKVFEKPLINPSPQIEGALKALGDVHVKNMLKHAVVKVNSLAIDPCFLRLGDHYTHLSNFPFREFPHFFKSMENIKHLVELTPEMVNALLLENKKSGPLTQQYVERMTASNSARRRLKRNLKASRS